MVRDYPADPVRMSAQEILDLINATKNQNKKDTTSKPLQKTYLLKADTAHYYIISFANNKLDANKLKIKLSDYNAKYYSTNIFNTNTLFLDTAYQIIVIKEFANKDKGIDYFNGIKENQEVFADFKSLPYQQFIISTDNFTQLYQEKDIPKYLAFFQANYLK